MSQRVTFQHGDEGARSLWCKPPERRQRSDTALIARRSSTPRAGPGRQRGHQYPRQRREGRPPRRHGASALPHPRGTHGRCAPPGTRRCRLRRGGFCSSAGPSPSLAARARLARRTCRNEGTRTATRYVVAWIRRPLWAEVRRGIRTQRPYASRSTGPCGCGRAVTTCGAAPRRADPGRYLCGRARGLLGTWRCRHDSDERAAAAPARPPTRRSAGKGGRAS
jgi:hypothetical protein